jgi:hypothetical protein
MLVSSCDQKLHRCQIQNSVRLTYKNSGWPSSPGTPLGIVLPVLFELLELSNFAPLLAKDAGA